MSSPDRVAFHQADGLDDVPVFGALCRGQEYPVACHHFFTPLKDSCDMSRYLSLIRETSMNSTPNPSLSIENQLPSMQSLVLAPFHEHPQHQQYPCENTLSSVAFGKYYR